MAWLLGAALGCATPTPLTAAIVTPSERWPGYPQRVYRVHTTNRGRFVELRPAMSQAEASGFEGLASTGDPRSWLAIFPQPHPAPRAPRVFTLLNRAGATCVVEVVRAVVLERRPVDALEETAAQTRPAPRALALEVNGAGCESADVALPGAHSGASLEPVPLQRTVRDSLVGVTPETQLSATLTFSPRQTGDCPALPATLSFDLDPARPVSLHVEEQVTELFLVHTGRESLVWVGHVGATSVYSLSTGNLLSTFVEMRDVGLGAGCTAGR